MGKQGKQKNLKAKGLKGALARHQLKEKLQKVSNTPTKKANDTGRKRTNQKAFLPFGIEDEILLIGEGDFSFACSIVKSGLAYPEKLKATSYDSFSAVIEKYDGAEDNIAYLQSEGVKVSHEVDATRLCQSLKVKASKKEKKHMDSMSHNEREKLSHIVFNFPHTGKGIKDVDRNIKANQELVLSFLKSADELFQVLGVGAEGKIVITLFEGEPYSSWNVKLLAKSVGYKVKESGKFDWSLFPSYHHRRTIGMGDTTKPSIERNARTYVFENFKKENKPSKETDDSD
ncbi:Piso0_001390 [Millerozyma farinosa CBS 7064]|uniref:Piso0_001390 protein n=1 Tax=Pichia sorbitophila (strain ATCC MYA-4447 / BCRC 22081 / CBS 7064 / NBRC 10061 / NRRL Y-12695) TaxID=559304 RepID=G8YN15_PICSO|nr:Piso0_001390 [Millerozyma farinosa CBS 7064]